MHSRLIIDGNAVYEIDEECMRKKGWQNMYKEPAAKESEHQKKNKEDRN